MALIAYLFTVTIVSIGVFWLTGFIYGLIHRPAIYFPLSLAIKMAAAAVAGTMFFIIGGIVLATLVFNAEMEKRPDYHRWPTILAGLVISLFCSVIIYFSIFSLAWKMLD